MFIGCRALSGLAFVLSENPGRCPGLCYPSLSGLQRGSLQTRPSDQEDEFGYGSIYNGSVHVEWNIGKRFDPFYSMDVQANNATLPKVILSLSLPPADGNCSFDLLKIPPPDRVRTALLQCTTNENPPSVKTIPLSYYAPDGPGFAAIRDIHVDRFRRKHLTEFSSVTVGADLASQNPIVEWVRDGNIFEVRTGTGLIIFQQINVKKFAMVFYLNDTVRCSRFLDQQPSGLNTHESGTPQAIHPRVQGAGR